MFTLLENGHGQGALGRARTLHEIAVASSVLSLGEDYDARTDLAERYLSHDTVISLRDAEAFQNVAERIGQERFGEDEMEEMREETESLTAKYGAQFLRDNGWAATLNEDKAPSFKRLEEVAELAHLRSYYSWASHEVHADSASWRQNTREWGGRLYRSTTRALDGLADPAQIALGALRTVTLNMLMCPEEEFDAETIIAMKVLVHLVDDACDAFIRAHLEIEAMSESEAASSVDPQSIPDTESEPQLPDTLPT